MTVLLPARALALACLVALPLGACVSVPVNSTTGRATELATLVSRSIACRAGSPRRDTLDRFLTAEAERGATPEQIASARSTYITVSEAQTINQGIRPERCDAEERAGLKDRMTRVRAGSFEAL
ncbi:hypothetical protein [Bosea sp. PAMC 26642]|uniref:hypothetical protein n=1 Tax=Bosea sp. (strain PAMC 26642) TaxID=1792307 RepID=UPI00077032EE|nr:hypothetical protein [Bosea sp. PAMC 26642]AMJ59869.1 hypothetical protein AXW83_05745 [Bosea sp. PAMC 26642]